MPSKAMALKKSTIRENIFYWNASHSLSDFFENSEVNLNERKIKYGIPESISN